MASELTYNVTVDTTPLQGEAGYLAFDFFQGSGVQDNVTTISAFVTNGNLGMLTPTGDANGTISPGPGTLDDKNFFFNEFLQAVTYGTKVSFTLKLTTFGSKSATADNFSLYLLNSAQFPIHTSDPSTADSLISINITGPGLTPNVYTSADATATVTPVTVVTGVPEPSSFWLAGLPLLSLIRRRCTKTIA
jgi:hypothetical protein